MKEFNYTYDDLFNPCLKAIHHLGGAGTNSEIENGVIEILQLSDEEVEDIITKIPKVIPDFLRTAKNLSNEEWNDLTEHVKNINKNK